MTSFAATRALQRPAEVAIRDEDVAMSWREVDDLLNRATHALLAEALGEHRRVAVFADNCVESVLAHLCGLLAGTSVVPINFHLNAEEVAYILEDSQTSVLFVGPNTADAGV
ncbi:MAG: AMP-binding protein, partial [Myxococcota bacterium]